MGGPRGDGATQGNAAQYARRVAVAPITVRRWLKAGKLTTRPDGLLDFATADRERAAIQGLRLPSATAAPTPELAELASEKLRHERAKRRRLELDLAERQGELVRSEAVALHVAGIFSTVQQRLRAMPANLAGRLAAVTGQGQHEAREILRAGIDEVLEDAAAALERDAQ